MLVPQRCPTLQILLGEILRKDNINNCRRNSFLTYSWFQIYGYISSWTWTNYLSFLKELIAISCSIFLVSLNPFFFFFSFLPRFAGLTTRRNPLFYPISLSTLIKAGVDPRSLDFVLCDFISNSTNQHLPCCSEVLKRMCNNTANSYQIWKKRNRKSSRVVQYHAYTLFWQIICVRKR